MNSTITLIIGGVDISEFTERENYSINKVWKTADSFTNYDGSPVTMRSGWNYRLHASLDNIPDKLMTSLVAALDNDKISITFTDPHSPAENMCTTDIFERGESTGGEVFCELDDGLRWNIDISLDSEFHSISDGNSGGDGDGL